MSDNGKKEEPQEKELKLTITLSNKEGLQVQGPGNGEMYDEPMCLYLLHKAGKFIERNNAQAAAKAVPAKGGIMSFARNRFKK